MYHLVMFRISAYDLVMTRSQHGEIESNVSITTPREYFGKNFINVYRIKNDHIALNSFMDVARVNRFYFGLDTLESNDFTVLQELTTKFNSPAYPVMGRPTRIQGDDPDVWGAYIGFLFEDVADAIVFKLTSSFDLRHVEVDESFING